MLPPRFRNLWLLIASLLFYALGDLRHLPLLLFTAFVQYEAAILMGKYPKYRRFFLISAISVNLWLLFYYKYAAFFLSLVGVFITAPPLPVGISFYTFQAISYTVDVYRNDTPPQKKFDLFATYLTLFPQLVAGPIVRYTEVNASLQKRSTSSAAFSEGGY